jgi:pyridoxamine 5'-phosphate oxidase
MSKAVHPAKKSADPFPLFKKWYGKAESSGIELPNAMTLSSVGADKRPSSRVVLMKSFDRDGIVFFTNYESRKGVELEQNPAIALVFWWRNLRRQIRIEGHVSRVSEEESDGYFASRPRGSRLGAWASRQSRPVSGRAALVAAFAKQAARFRTRAVPRPPRWGGYRVEPDFFEFWTHRENRMHVRAEYRRDADGTWRVRHLAP